MFVPKERKYYLKYFPLGEYICKAMIFGCFKRKCLLYEYFHIKEKVLEEVLSMESGPIKKHLIKSCLRKIRTALKNGLWKFEEMKKKYRLIGASLPQKPIYKIDSVSENDSEEISDDNEHPEDSSGSLS